jgi:hypothetical protein
MEEENDEENQYEYEEEEEQPKKQPQQQVQQQGQRTMQRARQNRGQQQTSPQANGDPAQQMVTTPDGRLTGTLGGHEGAIRQSRIKDRPVPKETRESSLKVKIELDLEVEVDLYARVKGDVTIGLM